MYQYVRDDNYISATYRLGANLVNQLVQSLRKYEVFAEMNTLGNRKRGLILRNDLDPVIYEFNLIVKNADSVSPKELKTRALEAFNDILDKNWQAYCEDTSYGLLTRSLPAPKPLRVPFRVQVTIIKIEEDGTWNRLIHFKTDSLENDEWYWLPIKYSGRMKEMEYYLKPQHWLRVRREYLNLRNESLEQDSHEMPMQVAYISAMDEVFTWVMDRQQQKEANKAQKKPSKKVKSTKVKSTEPAVKGKHVSSFGPASKKKKKQPK